MKKQRKDLSTKSVLAILSISCLVISILYAVVKQEREKASDASCLSYQRQIVRGIMMYIQDYDENYPITANLDSPKKALWTQIVQPYITSQNFYHCPVTMQDKSNFLWPLLPTPSHPAHTNSWDNRKIVSIGLTAQFILDKTGEEGFQKVVSISAIDRPADAIILADTPGMEGNIASENYEGGYMFDPCSPQSENGIPPSVKPTNRFLSAKIHLESLRGPIALRHPRGLNSGFADGHVKWRSRIYPDEGKMWRFRGCP
jgi:prepilin-type processing-associated H-X9-DG protein